MGTREFGESFLNPDIAAYSANWTIPNPNPSLSIGRKSGDNALKVAYLSPAWGGAIQRQGNSVSNNESILLHFRLEGANVGSILAAEASNGYRWEIYLQGTADVFTAQARYTSATQVISFSNLTGLDFQQNIWYVLLLVMDNDRLYLRAWQRDDPANFADHQLTGLPAGIATGQTWHFRSWTNNGTTWIDEYLEGQTYQLSLNEYGAESFPVHPDHGGYADLNIRWTYPTRETRMSFEGDGTWNAARTSYEYLETEQGGSTQYGNLTRTLHASWDAAQSAWRDYRLTITGYYPAPSPNNLVGLPGFSNQYACPSGLFNGACSANYPTYPPGNMVTASTTYVYDSNSNYYIPPTTGKLTRERQFLRFGNPTAYTDNRYQDTYFEYDSWGNPYRVTTWTGEGTYSAFASTGAQVTTSCYGSGAPPTCTDDGYGVYKAWERNALNQDTTYAYNKALGVLTEETGPNGSATKTTAGYDGFGRIIRVVRPGDTDASPTIAIVYGDNAAPFYTEASQKIQGSTLYKLRKYYNGLGQLLQTQVIGATVSGVVKDIRTDTFYDALGQVTKQTVPYATTTGGYFSDRSKSEAFTHTSYDVLGRATLVTAPDGADTTYTYLDLETRVTDDLNNTTRNLMDIWGRTVQVIPPTNPSVTYTYDALDRLLTANYGGAVTSLSYDYAGRKLSMNDPDMGAWSYAYDALGNLTRQKDAKNQRICFYYDALNRLTGKHYRTDDVCPATPTLNVTYTYDSGTYGKGQRTGMSDPSGSTAWTYDARGRMISEVKTISDNPFTTSWTYTSADLPMTMTYPDGEILTYQYLPQRLLDKIYSNRKPDGTAGTYYLVQDTLYDAAGRVDRRDLGATSTTANPVLVSDYNYNLWTVDGGRMNTLKAGIYSDQDSLLDLRYDYDNVGNLLSILDVTNSSQKQCFTYDPLNRLTNAAVGLNDATCTGSVGNGEYADQTYGYSTATGNLTSKTGLGSYTYDSTQPHAVDSVTGYSYLYDANGNMTRRDPAGTAYYDFAYDSENRLYQSKLNGVVIATFTYDGDGNRVKSVVGATTTYFVGSHYETSGGVITKYYLAGGTRLAMRKGSTSFYWLLSDHLGSTSKVATATGALHSQQLYKAWGESRYASGTLPTRYTYTGQYSYASDFGLVFYGSRFYDPLLGRFASPDSIIPQNQGTLAWDRYAYVNNSPLNYTDPTGHWIDDGCSTEGCGEWKPKSNSDKRNWAFTKIFQGSGKNGAWTTKDWDYYLKNYTGLWRGDTEWINPDSETGWDLFALHVDRLSANYSFDQEDQFMRDFSLVFGGISANGSWEGAAWDAKDGPTLPFLTEGNQGLPSQYIDSLSPSANQSHHYAGILFLSYFAGGGPGAIVNYARDPDNPGDINLGTLAAKHGTLLSGSVWNYTFQDLPTWIDGMSP